MTRQMGFDKVLRAFVPDAMDGERVRVRQLDEHAYAVGAAACLSGQIGTVTATERPHREGKVLVQFDAPAPTWWPGQTPPCSFWFDAHELEPA